MKAPTTYVVLVSCCLVLAAGAAPAHVILDAPNGGEVLVSGSVTTIEWHVQIQHNLDNWDLWYSTTGSGGPWIVIAEDLPAGDPTAGAMHTFEWTVPDTPSDEVRVRVRQDNFGSDYEDQSDADLSIATEVFGDDFETGDTSGWSGVVQ